MIERWSLLGGVGAVSEGEGLINIEEESGVEDTNGVV